MTTNLWHNGQIGSVSQAFRSTALYGRVSSAEQVLGHSLEGQEQLLTERCKELGITDYTFYADPGCSAKSIEGRPALQQLLSDISSGKFQILYVWKLNRLARNLKDLLQIVNHLTKYNVRLQSLTEDIQMDNAVGQFMVQLLGATAELELGQTRENVKLGIQERNNRGGWNSGNMVLGYRWNACPADGQQELEIIEEEALVVRQIFQMYADGLGYKKITNVLNAEGIRTKRGLAFSITAVRGILTNPNYIGKIRIGTSSKRANPGCEIQVIDGQQEPIINFELWNKVQQRILKQSRKSERETERLFLLTGLLKCPQCGAGMTAWHTNGKRKNGSVKSNFYYVCTSYTNKGSSLCKSNAVRVDAVEKRVIDQIESLVTKPQLLTRIVAAVNERRNSAWMPLEEERVRLEKELGSYEKRQERCFELFEQGHIDEDTLVLRLSDLKNEQHQISVLLAETVNKLSSLRQDSVDKNLIMAVLKKLRKIIQTAPVSQQKQLLRSLIEKITIPPNRDPTGMTIHFNSQLQQFKISSSSEEPLCKTTNRLA